MSVTLQIDQLSTKEKISIMEALWDNLCQKSEGISSPAWHDKVLKQRETEIINGSDSFIDWEEAKHSIRKSVIDTHIFIWLLKNPEQLTLEHVETLKSPHVFLLSSISIAEIMIKSSIGKLNVDYDPVDMALKSGLKLLNFSGQDANHLKDLPWHHKDPSDRMLIAQSLSHKIPIMTCDSKFKYYECTLV